MGEANMKDNAQAGIDEMIIDIHKHFKDRLERISERINTIEEKLSDVQQDNMKKAKDFGNAKKAIKKAAAVTAKTAVDIELLTSQEEVIGELNMESLGILNKLKEASPDNIESDIDLKKIYLLMNKMYEDLTKRFDSLENKLDKVEEIIEGRSSGKERDLFEGEEPKPIKLPERSKKALFKLNLKKNKADDLSL